VRRKQRKGENTNLLKEDGGGDLMPIDKVPSDDISTENLIIHNIIPVEAGGSAPVPSFI